eukprot:956818-Amphidinium_carterae.1
MKKRARSEGKPVQDIPAMIVFTREKDGAHKTRIVCCGNEAAYAHHETTTTDHDSGVLRYILSWGA